MSFVTTPTRRSSLSARQSAAMRLLLPDPTGPPTPIRSARSGSADKEALLSVVVDAGGDLEADGGGGLEVRDRLRVGGDRARGGVDLRRELGDPARGDGGVEPEQLERGAGDGGGVVVERDRRDLLRREAGGGADDAERDRARRGGGGGAVAVDRRRRPGRGGGAQQLGAEAAGD